MMLEAKMHERAQVPLYLENEIAAASAVAARRAAEGNILFAPERYAAVPALTGGNFNRRLVSKFHHDNTLRGFMEIRKKKSRRQTAGFISRSD